MIERTHFEVGETAVAIVCDGAFLPTVKDAVFRAREIVETKISEDPFFGITYDPFPPSSDDHPLIQRMCQSSLLADVGPMAGVAGAVAEFAADAAVRAGCDHIIIENGGDIALFTDRRSLIGVFSGDPKFDGLAFDVPPTGRMTGICSSSGTIGHSVSLGNSRICTVFSDDTVLADACATSLGNLIRKGTSDELSDAVERIASVKGVRGCCTVCNGMFASCGDIPELVGCDSDPSLLTSVRY